MMMRLLSKLRLLAVVGLMVAAFGATSITTAPSVSAINPEQEMCEGNDRTWTGSKCVSHEAGAPTVTGTFENIVNVLLFLLGAVAVIMFLVAGVKYTTSGGDQQAINSAKNTMLYAVVGLVVAFAAYAIVAFVLNAID